MSEVQELAYIDLRQYIVDNWNRVRLLNDLGEEVFVKPIPSGTRIRWTHTTTRTQVVIGTDLSGNPILGYINVQTNPKMHLRIQVYGSELTLPTNIASVELVNPNSHDTSARIKESLDTVANFTTAQDILTYTLNLDVGDVL